MKVIILGGGVIGVTSAWYLGHNKAQVIVDGQSSAGRNECPGHAGQISPGYATP